MLSSIPLGLTLKDLDILYNTAGIGKNKQDYYAKLAIIELCGWIEEFIDDMAREYCSSIRDSGELEALLGNVHGFNYPHLRTVLIQIVGITKVVEIEYQLQNKGISYAVLKSQLGVLTKKRNDVAHSHMAGVQRTYDAPSNIIHELANVEKALLDLKRELNAE